MSIMTLELWLGVLGILGTIIGTIIGIILARRATEKILDEIRRQVDAVIRVLRGPPAPPAPPA